MTLVLQKKFLTKPKQLLKLIVLTACVLFTIYQLAECVKKLVHPPASTHYSFNLNDTIKYPCLTICRRPAYKTTLFPNYGLRATTSLNAQTAFNGFDFENSTVNQFLEETSYSFEDIFGQYGYAGVGSNPNLTITEEYHLMRGRCYTLKPEVQSDTFSISGGYFFYLRHNMTTKDIDEYGVSKSGFQMYLHDSNEILTFEDDQKDSFLEYLYLEASEDMSVILNVQTYGRIPTNEHPCELHENYSKSKCLEFCVDMQVAKTAGCALAFLRLPKNHTFPECSDYYSVRDLISDMRNSREDYIQNCKCPMSCNITIYSTNIINRKDMDELNAPNSIISLYYSSNLVTKMNEVIGYDWNQFLSDIGGSMGFLLGLSVVGLISMIEQICQILFKWIFKKRIEKKRKQEEKQSEELYKGQPSKNNNDTKNDDDGKQEECKKEIVNKENDYVNQDNSYKNLMDYISDYSFYEKKLVDKAHDQNNKF